MWTEYLEIPRISPYSVRMWENTDQKRSEYGHFLRSVKGCKSKSASKDTQEMSSNGTKTYHTLYLILLYQNFGIW